MFIRDLQLFRSYRLRLLSLTLSTAFSLTLFYYISRLVHAAAIASPDEYYAYVVVGMIILGIVSSTLTTPVVTLRQELLTGTFERMVLSPFGPIGCVLALMVFPLVLAFGISLFSLLFAGVLFGLRLHWSTAAVGVPVVVLGAIAFCPFGLVMTIFVILAKQTRSGSTFVVTALTVISGIYFPTVLLPGWIRWLSSVQPFTPAVELLRHVLIATPLTEPVPLTMAKLVLFPAVLLPLTIWLLKLAIERARRHGTVIEY